LEPVNLDKIVMLQGDNNAFQVQLNPHTPWAGLVPWIRLKHTNSAGEIAVATDTMTDWTYPISNAYTQGKMLEISFALYSGQGEPPVSAYTKYAELPIWENRPDSGIPACEAADVVQRINAMEGMVQNMADEALTNQEIADLLKLGG